MAKENILVIEDEDDIQELLKFNLSKEGYRVNSVMSGEDGIKDARTIQPDLILLDLMLPGVDGLEVCKMLKHDSKTQHIPIVMLTAKGEESDVVSGLELGADDYITKPFSPKILIARIRSILRRRARGQSQADSTVKIHDLVIHPGRHEVTLAGKQIELTLTEFQILQFLSRHPGWVFTRYQIVNAIRGDETIVTDRSVDVQIVGLRKKLGHAGKYIETIRGVGYKFKE